MNLVQIQERLKDLPMQAVMAYANGQNPQVPPYLALGELNRRKQMEQQAAQPPRGTVKDNIEQQVGLMQLQKLRQGQMAQQSAMQGAQSPTVPEGVPQPVEQPEAEMAMAAGGVTSLPTQDMHFGSGGIIAFANPEGKQLVEDDDLPLWARQARRERLDRQRKLDEERNKNMAAVANADFVQPVMENDPRLVGTTPAAETVGTMPPVAKVPPVAQTSAIPNTGIATTLNQPAAPRPPAPPAPPAIPAQSDAEKYLAGILSNAKSPDLPKPFEMPKQAPIGEDYLKYVADRELKRKADEEKFKQREAGRSQRDFFNSLIAAGEATRGQKGIGSLFGGFGKAYSQAATEAEDRQTAFENAMQEKADLDAKMKFEIANLRRAEERGDAKGVYDSKIEIAKIQQQQQTNAITAAGHMASNASAERVARANNLTQLEVARIHQATAGMPDATERMTAKYAEIKRTQGEPAAEEYLKTIERIKTGSRGETAQEKLNVQRQALASKYPAYMSAMNTYATNKDPQKRDEALAVMRRIEEAEGIKSKEGSTTGKVIDFSKI